MVRADSVIVSRTTTYSGAPSVNQAFTYGTVTLCGVAFQQLRLAWLNRKQESYNPRMQASWFGLIRVRSPLLTESMSLSSPSGTEMFQFPEFPLLCRSTRKRVGFPIRTSPDQSVSPARPGFSQVIASFIGSSARASTVDPWYLDHLRSWRSVALFPMGFSRAGTPVYAFSRSFHTRCHASRLA